MATDFDLICNRTSAYDRSLSRSSAPDARRRRRLSFQPFAAALGAAYRHLNGPARALLVVLATCMVGGFSGGCRALRNHQQTRSLSTARQLSLRGASMLQQENYDEAAPLFAEALRHSPADERAHWGMAEVEWRQGKQSEAIKHMEMAVRLSGQSPEMLVKLGEMYRQSNQLDAALQAAEHAISRDRTYHAAWSLKGRVLTDQQRFQDALDCYQRALIYRPDDAETRIAVAELYQHLNRPQRVLATLDRLADSQPTAGLPAAAWILKSQALAELGQLEEAQYCLREAALRADDADADLLLRMARMQLQFGELAEARVCLGRARQADPDNPEVGQLQRKLDTRFASMAKQDSLQLLPAAFSVSSDKSRAEPTTSPARAFPADSNQRPSDSRLSASPQDDAQPFTNR